MFQVPKSAILALAVFCLGQFPHSAAGEEAIQYAPPNSLVWVETPEGVAFAALRGDRFVEAYMAMVRLPAGLVSPPHTKSADMFGVVISGAMTHAPVGVDPDPISILPQGSFYRVPAGLAHVSSCVSKTECVTFLYQNGKFDFQPLAP